MQRPGESLRGDAGGTSGIGLCLPCLSSSSARFEPLCPRVNSLVSHELSALPQTVLRGWIELLRSVLSSCCLHCSLCAACPALTSCARATRSARPALPRESRCARSANAQVKKENASKYGCIVYDPETSVVLHYVEKPESYISNTVNGGVYCEYWDCEAAGRSGPQLYVTRWYEGRIGRGLRWTEP